MSTGPGSVVVVGAGALGLATAWHLTGRGLTDVTVIERGRIAGASSGLSVGIIESQYLDPLAIEVRVDSMRSFAALERAGALDIVLSPEELAVLDALPAPLGDRYPEASIPRWTSPPLPEA